jgi:hypothetical protein
MQALLEKKGGLCEEDSGGDEGVFLHSSIVEGPPSLAPISKHERGGDGGAQDFSMVL